MDTSTIALFLTIGYIVFILWAQFKVLQFVFKVVSSVLGINQDERSATSDPRNG